MDLKLKVCGMRGAENIRMLGEQDIDYLGLIFYPESPRFVGYKFDKKVLKAVPDHVKKVGVFVSRDLEELLYLYKRYELDYLQLHGDFSSELCEKLKNNEAGVIKTFSIDENFDFSEIEPYKAFVDYFLFDTKGKYKGGNGVAFDWSLLSKYDNEVPFFLSGGIGVDDVDELKKLQGMNLHALDVNSRFERKPGLKDIDQIERFIKEIK